jgi:hypothetical protein
MNMDFVPFPECAKNCGFVKSFGVGECESVCPDSFHKDGSPVSKSEYDAVTSARITKYKRLKRLYWIHNKLERFCARQTQVRTQHRMMSNPISTHFQPQTKIWRCPEFMFKLASRLEFWARTKIKNSI